MITLGIWATGFLILTVLFKIAVSIKEEVRAAVDGIFESQRFILGAQGAALEEEIAQLCGVPFAVGVASGTDALLACLMAEKIGPGDEVITAIKNVKYKDGKPVNEGPQIEIGGNDKYISVCRRCYSEKVELK